MKDKLLLTNTSIISSGRFIENGEILIQKGKITAVGEYGSISKTADAEEIDLGGRISMPGFVNPHTHLYSALATGLSPKGPTPDFKSILENFWWPLDAVHDEESVYYSTLSGLINAVKHGVTCIFDHHASMNFVSGSLETIEKALSMAGLKSVCCFEVSDRHSSSDIEEQVKENIDFIESHKKSDTTKGMLGLHANFTLSKQTLRIISDITAGRTLDYPIHIHCGEGSADLDFCIEDGYAGPVDRLHSYGLIGSSSILAHCVHLSETDEKLLAELNPFIISNPESNANNRVGTADRGRFPSYLIGTDGMSYDMISSLRSQYLLGSGLSENFAGLYTAFIERPAKLVKTFFPSSGKLESGYDADIAVLDYIPETPISEDSLMGHLIFGAQGGKVHMTIASGNILYRDGKLTFTFESALNEKIRHAALELHRRYYG